MEILKVNFGYFWPSFKKEDNYFTRILSQKYNLEISENPDIYFFTHPYNGKRDYLKYKCHRVFLGWENKRADWNICDYVLDSDFYENNPRHKRWPIWAAWRLEQLTAPKNIEAFKNKKKFACMVVSNGKAKERIAFFNDLSKYKHVDSGGRFLNNIGGSVENKMEFIKDYKFVISFENSSYRGYTTEKLIEPMLVNSIPVYWGNEDVGKDFNTNSFIHVNQYASYNEVIKRMIELDNDDDQYLQLVMQPWFNNNRLPKESTNESLADFFNFVISDMKAKPPVATSFVKSNLHKLDIFKNKAKAAVYRLLKYRFLSRLR